MLCGVFEQLLARQTEIEFFICFLWVCVGCLRDWSVACGMCRYVFMGVCRLLERLVGSLWNVSVCFLWVCVGCLGDGAVACGMCRCVFYGYVSVAWETGR